MSEELTYRDFASEVDSWMFAFPNADPMQRKHYYNQFKNALAVMRYFDVHRGRPTVANCPMLYIDCSFNVVRRHADAVKIDLTTVWNGVMVGEDRSRHAFRDTDGGFEMHFATTPHKEYFMNGVLQIEARRG